MVMDLSLGVIDSDRLTLEEGLNLLSESEDYALMLQHDKDVNPFLECDFCGKKHSTLKVME
jgi:hypothetical protein